MSVGRARASKPHGRLIKVKGRRLVKAPEINRAYSRAPEGGDYSRRKVVDGYVGLRQTSRQTVGEGGGVEMSNVEGVSRRVGSRPPRRKQGGQEPILQELCPHLKF